MKRKVYLVCLCFMPLMICSGIVYSVLTIYFYDLGASKTQIGFIFTVGAISGAVVAPFMGKLSDRFGRKKILIPSMLGFGIAFLLYAFLRKYTFAYPIQVLEGGTWGAYGATATALIADIAPKKDRGWAMGIYNQAWNLGWIIGPALGGFLADRIGFRTTFAISSVFVLFGATIGIKFIKE